MIPGIASLRCPHCERPFLSMPHRPDALVTCPHCAHSAPMMAFGTAGTGTPMAAALPIPVQRRVLPDRAPPAPTPWPPAPEQPQPPAGVEPQPPPDLEDDDHQEDEFTDDPLTRNWTPRPPVTLFEPPPDGGAAALPPISCQPRRGGYRVLLMMVAMAALAAGSWMVWESLQPRPEGEAALAEAESQRETALVETAAALERDDEEVLRLEQPVVESLPVDLAAANEASLLLLTALFDRANAATPEATIADADQHAAEIKAFLARPGLVFRYVKPVPTNPYLLPGLAVVPLFQVFTSENQNGALLRLLPQADGSFRIHWPLFFSTHERLLARFQDPGMSEPGWLDVALRRSHGLDLPEAIRKRQIAFDLQGSGDSSLMVRATAGRDTALGRLLDRDVQWGRIYLARLLLQRRELGDGVAGVVILDCEGASAGR